MTIIWLFNLIKQLVKICVTPHHDVLAIMMEYELLKYEARKHQILNATFKRIYEQGIAGLTMRSIANEAKINQALLHYYFRDKENLLTEFVRVLSSRFIYDIEKRYKPSDPPQKKLEAFFEAGRDLVENQKELFVVLIEIWAYCFRDSFLKKNFANPNKRLTGVMKSILEEGKREEVFNEVREDTLANFFVAFVIGIGCLWHMDNRSFDLGEHFNILTRNLKQIILKDKIDIPANF